MNIGRAANKKASTKELIYEAGMTLFQEKGFAHTTMQDISIRAGIAKSTIFNYFNTKEEILLKFGRNQVAKLKEFEKTLSLDLDTKARVLALLVEDMSGAQQSPNYARIQLTEVNRSDWVYTLEAQNRRDLAALYEQILQKGQDKGELVNSLDCDHVAGLIVAIYFHLLYSSIEQHSAFNIRDALTKSLDIIWNGICPREPMNK